MIKNYQDFLFEKKINSLYDAKENSNESLFNFDYIQDKLKDMVMNLFKVSSNPFESIKSLWKNIRSNEKLCYILLSIITVSCGVPKSKVLTSLENDPKVLEIMDRIERDSTISTQHVVKKGESLLSISKKYGMYYTDLIHKNRLRNVTIQPGQVLLIPNQSERDLYSLEQKPEDFEKIQFGKQEETPEKEVKVDTTETEMIEPAKLANGFFNHSTIIKKRIKNLELANMKVAHAIVLHRTATKNLEGTLKGFKERKIGTHFLIDYDGTIYQTAGVDKITAHVGEIRSRAVDEGKASKEEMDKLKKIGWSPKKIHRHEIKKTYPNRYPHNSDAIGIEVMGGYDTNSEKWQDLTPAQIKSVKFLLKTLMINLRLSDKDIYVHEKISYKTHDEGGFVLRSINKLW